MFDRETIPEQAKRTSTKVSPRTRKSLCPFRVMDQTSGFYLLWGVESGNAYVFEHQL